MNANDSLILQMDLVGNCSMFKMKNDSSDVLKIIFDNSIHEVIFEALCEQLKGKSSFIFQIIV